MTDIHKLPAHLVNKIAAGEVIERPASVVKELVENALDSGARRIEIRVDDGGRKLIRVTDDGAGMSADDLALAFLPHATSKIAGEEDLTRIATMGFRGEALASIASIAQAHIRTRPREEASGSEIEAAGETLGEVRPCAASPGTTVTVRNLFFNTPARRKFLRAANTEFAHVTEQLARLALPHPQVAYVLEHNGRKVQNLPAAQTTAQRAADFFGGDLAEALLPVSPRGERVAVRGLVGPPSAARASGKWQYFFLNGRYIRDRVLSHALREAYRGRIDPSRWPVALLFLEMDPEDFDVNVHPTKVEVRFRESQLVHGEVLAALKETLNRSDLAPGAELDEPDPGEPGGRGSEARQESLRQALADFFKSAPRPAARLNFAARSPSPVVDPAERPEFFERSAPAETLPVRPAAEPTEGETTHRTGERYVPEPSDEPEAPGPAGGQSGSGDTHPLTPPRPSSGAIQVHDSYLVAATDDGLIIVDQHALHERVLYNEFRRRLADAPLPGQRLLIPETLSVSAEEADLLERHADLLARLGIEVAPFGPQTVAIQRFPTLLQRRKVSPAAFLRDVADLLEADPTADAERLLEDLLAMMACKAAVKAGDPLTQAEIDDLLARGKETDKHSACPHGRPTTLKLTLRELARQFQRT